MSEQDRDKEARPISGPVKGDFLAPPETGDAEEPADALPQQEEFLRPPVRGN